MMNGQMVLLHAGDFLAYLLAEIDGIPASRDDRSARMVRAQADCARKLAAEGASRLALALLLAGLSAADPAGLSQMELFVNCTDSTQEFVTGYLKTIEGREGKN